MASYTHTLWFGYFPHPATHTALHCRSGSMGFSSPYRHLFLYLLPLHTARRKEKARYVYVSAHFFPGTHARLPPPGLDTTYSSHMPATPALPKHTFPFCFPLSPLPFASHLAGRQAMSTPLPNMAACVYPTGPPAALPHLLTYLYLRGWGQCTLTASLHAPHHLPSCTSSAHIIHHPTHEQCSFPASPPPAKHTTHCPLRRVCLRINIIFRS